MDSWVAALAREQHGVVAARQLWALGLTRSDIAYRVRTGRLHPLFRGVYAVGHGAVSQRGWLTAAVLAIGDGAVVSHRAACVLWGLWRWEGGAIDVTVARRVEGPKGVRVHAVRTLDPRDVTRRHGVPTTTPARTLLDLAAVLDPESLTRHVRQAEADRLVSVASLGRDLERWGNRRGAARLATVIAGGPAPTASALEDRFVAFLDQRRLPRPELNVTVHNYRVDALYREHGLVVELDSRRWHDSPLAQAHDRERTAVLEAAGWRVIRITWADLVHHADRTERRLRAALDQSEAATADRGTAPARTIPQAPVTS